MAADVAYLWLIVVLCAVIVALLLELLRRR